MSDLRNSAGCWISNRRNSAGCWISDMRYAARFWISDQRYSAGCWISGERYAEGSWISSNKTRDKYFPILFSLLKKGVPFIVSVCTVTVRAGFLCAKTALLRDPIKTTVYYVYIGYANPCWTKFKQRVQCCNFWFGAVCLEKRPLVF
jgi:hypothetical protein